MCLNFCLLYFTLLYFWTLINFDGNIIVQVQVLVLVHHLSSSHSNLFLYFRFNVAQVIWISGSAFPRVVASVFAILNARCTLLCNIFYVLIVLVLDHHYLFRLILISRVVFFSFNVATISLLI